MNEVAQQIIAGVEQELGTTQTPYDRRTDFQKPIYLEDVKNPAQIRCIDFFVGRLVSMAKERTISKEDVRKAYETREPWLAEQDQQFSDFPMTGMLGAVKRRKLWFDELNLYYETDLFNEDIRICDALESVIQEALIKRSET